MEMNKYHTVENITVQAGEICLIVDGQLVSRKLSEVSERLAVASETAQQNFVISSSGYGIHWPDCDEDLSIDGLLGLQHEAPMIAAEDPGDEYKTKNDL
jgi:hypothetical protein